MNFAKWLGFCGLVVSFYVLWRIRFLLLLVFAAVVLATALNRLVHWFQKLGLRRNWALLFTLGLTLSLTVLFIWSVVPPFIEQFQNLLDLLPDAVSQLRDELAYLEERLPEFLPQPPSLSEAIAQLTPSLFQGLSNFVAFFQTSLATLLKLLFVIILMLMMVNNPPAYRRGFLRLVPSFYRRRMDEILTASEVALGSWLSGMVINCLFIGISSGVGLWFLGVELVLLHALIAGVLNFIPNIGPLLSAIFPVAIALLDAPWKVVAVLIWYLIIQNIETYVLSPTVMQNKVSLLPAVTLTAQIFFARTFGLLGLILALPLTVVAKTWVEGILFEDIVDSWVQ